MYRHCLFCTANLGRNEALEAFPVGRRLAYDAAKGRLWVVCARCTRWNLTPLEERWEAIEQAERLFRGTRLRASTDNVGLGRVGDGVDLIRIGAPLRPEFAAWRYRNHAWRRQQARQIGVSIAFGAGAVAAVAIGTIGLPLVATNYAFTGATHLVRWARHGPPWGVAAVLTHGGRLLAVRRRHLAGTRLLAAADGVMRLRVEHDAGALELAGDAAARAARVLLPASNWLAGSESTVQRAVQRLEVAGDADTLLREFVRRGPRVTSHLRDRRAAFIAGESLDAQRKYHDLGLLALDASVRVAVEMALHESRERAALEGELAELQREWRDAEDIAAIADSLALPARVEAAFARLRDRHGA